MNRKQLFTNPAETNAHGSIRTAKWAKGAVAVVALSGALGVASMNTTTASADEITTEVVAPTATEEVVATPAETVATEQPVAEVAPAVETSAPVEEVASAPVAEVPVVTTEEIAPVAEETQTVPETAVAPAEENVATDVTSAEVVTNAGKEVATADYTISADLVPKYNDLATEPADWEEFDSKVSINIPNAQLINPGDTITLTSTNGTLLYYGDVRDKNSGLVIANVKEVGQAEYTTYLNAVDINSENKATLDSLTPAKLTKDMQYVITFKDAISEIQNASFDLNRTFTMRVPLVAEEYKDTKFKSEIKGSDGAVLDSETLLNATITDVSTPNAAYLSGHYVDLNTGGSIVSANMGNASYTKGSVITWTFDDPNYSFSHKQTFDYADGSRLRDSDIPDGSVVTISNSKESGSTAAGLVLGAGGVYGPRSGNMKYKILQTTDNSVSIEILEDTEYMGNMWVALFDVAVKDPANINSEGKLSIPAPSATITYTAPDSGASVNYPIKTGTYYNGVLATGQTSPLIRYNNILNAVLEDGTLIKESMDSSGLLKVGETFTLTGDEKIQFNGIWYIPKDGNVNVDGTTIDKEQVLTKVYVYSPKDNHAFVNLTVNHIDKETGAVLKTNTTTDHEETTAYTTSSETFPEYTLEGTPSNASGTFAKENVVVNYYYNHKKGSVVAKFVDENGKELIPAKNIVTSVNTGTSYTATHDNEVQANGTTYRWVSVDGSETGIVKEGTTTITNHYVLVKGTLIEKYVDLGGQEIKTQNNVLTNAPVKTAYSLEHPNEIQANGTTYRYVRTDGSETGQLVEGTTVVTYIYDTVKGDVVVKVVDAKTGNNIFPAETVIDDKPITKTTYDVTSYNKARITGKDGKTWDLVSVDGSQTGKVVEGVTTITFKYNEVKTSVTTKLVSTDGKELRSPSTDADLSTGVTYNTISKAPEVIYATDNNVYKRTAIPSNSQGITTVDPITVTYIYELQTAEPTKTIASTDGRDLTGKVLLAGDKVVYNFSTDLAKFKGIDGLSTEDKQHALIIVEDIADEFLTPNMSQASVSSGKAFLNYYASIEEAPESIKSVLSAKEVSTTGGFAVLTSFNPLATAEEIKTQNLAFFNEFTNKGLNVSVVLPTTVNATVDNAKIENKVIQIDFDGVTESPVVVNETPDINPTKDIVLNAGDEESLQGKQITVGTVFNYELNGTVYPANRGNKLTSYQQVDKHSDKVLPTGVYLTKATAEIQFEDGYKLGDEIIIPAGTVVKGSWVTPVDIVSDKDGSVIKAGSTVVKDGSPQVEYTIEKDIVVAAGTDVTGIVFPIGSDFSAIFRQFIDAENNTVTYSMRQDAFEKVSADSAFGFTTYMQVEQIAAGTTENTYTEIVNGVETKSNTVTHEGVEPEVPGEDTPTPSTPVVNTPGDPADAPVSAAGVATLPNTGEENSSAAALAGAAMLVAALGLAGRRRKEEK